MGREVAEGASVHERGSADGAGPFRGQRFLLALSVLLLVIAWLLVRPYLAAVAFAAVFGFLLHAPYARIRRFVRYPSVAAGIVLVLVAVAFVLPVTLVGVALADDVAEITESVQSRNDVLDLARGGATALGLPRSFVDPALETAEARASGFLGDAFFTTVSAATEFTIALVVFFILLYFLLVDGGKLMRYLRRVIPLDATRRDRLLARTGERVKAIILGTLLVGVVQGVAAGLGWWVLGYPAPAFWGFVMTLLAIIPFAGPFFVLIPAGVIRFAQGDAFAGIALVVYGIVLVGLVDDIVRPWAIGRQSGVHPAVVLVGILGGVAVFGLTGFVLGPLLLSLLGPVLEAWARPEDAPLAGEKDDADEEPARGGGPTLDAFLDADEEARDEDADEDARRSGRPSRST